MKTIRNVFHTVLGFTLAYWVCNHTGVFEMNLPSRLFLGLVAGLFTSFIIGVAIEYFQNVVLKQTFDEMDVLRTMIGGVIGGFLQISNIEFIDKWMLYGCLFICVLELIRVTYYHYKK
jgi:H+/Cl- antiporter ClcA